MGVVREKIKVYDMTCTSCEVRVETAIKRLNGVHNVLASYSSEQVIVEYDTNRCSNEKIKLAIKNAGYSVENSKSFKILGILIIAAAILLLSITASGVDMNSKLKNASYFMLFVIGVLTSLHCVGMCGGIMLSQSINNEGNEHKNKFQSMKPSILYNVGRILSYTILGGIVGALGSVLSLSIKATATLQIIAGIFMIIMGFNMSGFSMFRKFDINILFPKIHIKKKPKTPFFIGMLNGLMPCGPLQTMQLYALGTGSAFKGALSLFIFSLGTVPLMLTFGTISVLLTKGYTKTILKFSGIVIILLGLIMGNRGLTLAGISVPTIGLSKQNQAINSTASTTTEGADISNDAKPVLQNGVQVLKMSVLSGGYSPSTLYVEKNKPVKWVINGTELDSCNSYLIVPDLNIQKQLTSGNNIIQFTPKNKDINFTCGMGMINGVITVVDNLNSVKTSNSTENPSTSSSNSGSSSIYGNDLNIVPTNVLVNKSIISGNIQNAEILGIGNDFKPIITVAQKNIKTHIIFDLGKFNNYNGTFSIISGSDGKTLTTFNGTKGISTIDVTFSSSGIYGIVKDNKAIGLIDVVDNLQTANLETIRQKYLSKNQ